MPTDLKGLIERVEIGAGADRGLDAEVAFAVGLFDFKLSYGLEHCRIEAGVRERDYVEVILRNEKGGGLSYTERYPAFTSSIDAVLALIEAKLPEANCHGFDRDPSTVCAYVSRNNVASGHWIIEGFHPKEPARALLAAALRAIQDSKGERDGRS